MEGTCDFETKNVDTIYFDMPDGWGMEGLK